MYAFACSIYSYFNFCVILQQVGLMEVDREVVMTTGNQKEEKGDITSLVI